jgi:class 3 adenylate cyclase/predicted ATPase
MNDVREWLQSIGLGQYADSFVVGDIDWELLPQLDHEVLKELGVSSPGHRLKILKAIDTLATPEAEDDVAATTDELAYKRSSVASGGQADRRQLTVMFCDLVGSTALSEKLDPEEYRDLLASYQSATRHAIERYDGYIARYMGDGILAYFGYPQAHEADAERAVRAGLGVLDAIKAVRNVDGESQRVRIGIATGLVVAGDIVGEGSSEERAVLGETPNLAARLQATAKPDSIIVSEATARLVSGFFDLQQLELVTLKGIREPVVSFRVERSRSVQSRSEMLASQRLTPLVGRQGELALVLGRWEQATSGSGQAVLLSAEPGVGKTRLVHELRSRLPEEHAAVTLYCSPYHTSSPLHPVIASLRRAVALPADASPTTVENILEGWLREQSVPATGTPYLAHLLSVPLTASYAPLNDHPEVLRRRTLELLLSVISGMSEKRPILLVGEDLHWADPTTLELLGLTIDRLQSCRLLALLTFRPEFEVPWTAQPHLTSLSLNHLTMGECRELAISVARQHDAPAESVAPILDRADGVPLFVEELARSVSESNLAADGFVPEGLQDALMARLDRMGSAKRLAQQAAVIGRDFTSNLLQLVVGSDDLDSQLDQLMSADLLRHLPSAERYRFKHALIHDVAYNSLLNSEKRELHKRVARALEREGNLSDPELLAHHYEAAEDFAQAVAYRTEAGNLAARGNALKEAERNYEIALNLLGEVDRSEESIRQRVELMVALGAVQMVVYGFGSGEVSSTYEEARDLNDSLSIPVDEFEVMWGLWLNRQMRSKFAEARNLANRVSALAQHSDDSNLHLQAHHAEWMTALSLGDVATAFEHSEQGLSIYDPELHGDHAFRYGGHDPGVCGGGHNAISNWLMGYPDRAITRWSASEALAQRLDHRGSIGIGRHLGVWLHQLLGDAPKVIELTEDTEGAPAHLRAQMAAIRGWALAAVGDVAAGLSQCESGLANYLKTGASVRLAYLRSLQADTYRRAGRIEEAMAACDEAFARLADGSERWLRPELHRLKAELLANSREGWSGARREMEIAIRVAQELGGRSLELRAAISMARMLAERGNREDAEALLSLCYRQFSEGHGTSDLLAAKQLLGELR